MDEIKQRVAAATKLVLLIFPEKAGRGVDIRMMRNAIIIINFKPSTLIDSEQYLGRGMRLSDLVTYGIMCFLLGISMEAPGIKMQQRWVDQM